MLALLVAFSSAPLAAQTASPSPSPSAATENPFCQVGVWEEGPLVPGGSDYVVTLDSYFSAVLSAHVTLIADSGAYDASIPDSKFTVDPGYFGPTVPAIVSLPPGTTVRYTFVDSYTVAGKEKVFCPTQPNKTGQRISATTLASVGAATHVAATFLQALPPMPCGKMYTDARVKGYSPRTGFYGNKDLTAEVHVYIDAGGNVVKSSIYKSSGVPGVDDEALSSAEQSTYAAATFLCTPVVSNYLFTFTYQP